MAMNKEAREELRMVLNGYFAKIFNSPDITRDDILDMLEADLKYMDGEDAIAEVEQMLSPS
jgi:hypothetical protein